MSLLPGPLRAALAALAEGRGRRGLAERSQAITAGYRSRRGSDSSIATEDDALAYALARMPATHAAAEAALERLKESVPGLAPVSLLDVGCGPGTASFASAAAFPSLEALTLLDRNRALLALAGKLAADGLPAGAAELKEANILSAALPPADLVVAGYVLAEIAAEAQPAFVQRLWGAARQALLLVEPGTPDGFARLRAARTALIAAGAHVAAPCTHEQACPMAGEDWCRFLVRVQRSRDHKLLKQGDRPFEDEPYAYLALTRERAAERPAGRLVGRPVEMKANVALPVCNEIGLHTARHSRRTSGQKFRIIQKIRWGDGYNSDF